MKSTPQEPAMFVALRDRTLSAFCLALTLTGSAASAANLTGVMVFSCDFSGSPAGNFVWDTRGSDSDFYKIWIAPGQPTGHPDGLTAPFLNGPSWAEAPIRIPLLEGSNAFSLFFQHNGDWPSFALHLFFESHTVATISALTPVQTNHVIPPFTANSAPLTYSLTSYPHPNAPAAGTLSTVDDDRITLSAVQIAATNLYQLDRVSTHSTGPNHRFDYIGTFTLEVARRPHPPRIQVHITEATICWDSETNQLYQLQYSSQHGPHNWINSGSPVQGNGRNICVSDRIPVGEGQRFYRIVAAE